MSNNNLPKKSKISITVDEKTVELVFALIRSKQCKTKSEAFETACRRLLHET